VTQLVRIAIAGFQHETNSFGVSKAAYEDFVMADSWPGMLFGDAVISKTRGMNLPIAGFVDAASALVHVSLSPVLWCAAEPSGPVTDDAFERIVGDILSGVRDAGPIDGIYLDLHGAMVTETLEDGEGELLHRIRSSVGPNLPIVVSLDLHANVTPRMVRDATAMAIYRTYPHLDMAETGRRCVDLLMRQIRGAPLCKAFRQVPFLIPLSAQYTGAEPCLGLYAALARVAVSPEHAEIALGFSASDIHDAGPVIVAYSASQSRADELADQIMTKILAAETRFDTHLATPSEAISIARANTSGKPVVIADVQDNPGAGATSDSTGLLTALSDNGVKGALLGLMHDPEMAGRAHSAGENAAITGALGGKSGLPGHVPFEGRFRIETLSDGQCAYTGEMYGGGIATLGPSAVLRLLDTDADIRVVVTSIRNQCLDLAHFTHFGLDPRAARIACVKSTVHFRADFESIAATVIPVAAPGNFLCRLEEVPYRRLRRGVRLGPGGPVFDERQMDAGS